MFDRLRLPLGGNPAAEDFYIESTPSENVNPFFAEDQLARERAVAFDQGGPGVTPDQSQIEESAMGDKAWKQTERKVAAALGGERVPVTGRQRGSAPDVAHEWLSIEVKHRKEMPAWLMDAMAQARASIRGNQLPVVVLHENGRHHKGDLVVIRLEDFVDWFGNQGIVNGIAQAAEDASNVTE